MILSTRSFSALVQSQVAAIQGRARALIDFAVGSVLRSIVEANAGLSLWLQAEAVRILLVTRAATSKGADLDSFVGDFGLARLGSSASVGTVTFSRFSPSVQALIPVGTTVQTADGTQNFAVVADTTNPAYNVGLGGYVIPAGLSNLDVPVNAVIPGAAANVAAGTISVMTVAVPYVDTVINLAGMASGADAEPDEALRTRFIRYIQSLSRGTIPAIIFAVTSLRVGVQCTVMENVNADGSAHDGFLCVTVDDGSGAPGQDLITAAMGAVNAYRAGGIWCGVFPPIAVPVDVSLVITTAAGFDHNVLTGQVATTVSGYVASLQLGESLSWSKIAAVAYGVSEGITNVSAVTLNGSQNDLTATPRMSIKPRSMVVV